MSPWSIVWALERTCARNSVPTTIFQKQCPKNGFPEKKLFSNGWLFGKIVLVAETCLRKDLFASARRRPFWIFWKNAFRKNDVWKNDFGESYLWANTPPFWATIFTNAMQCTLALCALHIVCEKRSSTNILKQLQQAWMFQFLCISFHPAFVFFIFCCIFERFACVLSSSDDCRALVDIGETCAFSFDGDLKISLDFDQANVELWGHGASWLQGHL